MKKEKVIVILGPTATGKTALSIELAQKYNGEIISADSRQVYTGLDLGTGKVTKKEMSGVPHHLLDVANPKKVFTVTDYTKQATKVIEDILTRGKVPIVVGGTGFYIDALISGIVLPEVPPNKLLRIKLEKMSVEKLYTKLQTLDRTRAQTIDKNNPVRLVRAIEIATALGAVPKLKNVKPQYTVLKIGLDMSDDKLKERIEIRLKERLEQGMLREATKLHTQGLSWARMRNLGLEYRHMADHLTKKTTVLQFEKNLATDIWHYVKRQRTWFKRDTTITWFDPTKKSTIGQASTLVKKFLA